MQSLIFSGSSATVVQSPIISRYMTNKLFSPQVVGLDCDVVVQTSIISGSNAT